MEDKYLEIFNHFGVKNQMKKLNEESYELIEAVLNMEEQKQLAKVSENERYKLPKYKEELVGEVADVLALVEQIIQYFEIEEDELEDAKFIKLVRTLKRIQTGYYEEEK